MSAGIEGVEDEWLFYLKTSFSLPIRQIWHDCILVCISLKAYARFFFFYLYVFDWGGNWNYSELWYLNKKWMNTTLIIGSWPTAPKCCLCTTQSLTGCVNVEVWLQQEALFSQLTEVTVESPHVLSWFSLNSQQISIFLHVHHYLKVNISCPEMCCSSCVKEQTLLIQIK